MSHISHPPCSKAEASGPVTLGVADTGWHQVHAQYAVPADNSWDVMFAVTLSSAACLVTGGSYQKSGKL